MKKFFVLLIAVISALSFLPSCKKEITREKTFCAIAKDKFPNKFWRETTPRILDVSSRWNNDGTIDQTGCPTGYWSWINECSVTFSKSGSIGKFEILEITDRFLKIKFTEHNQITNLDQPYEFNVSQ